MKEIKIIELWRVGKENEELFGKKTIQNQFKRRTDLIIDQVKHGYCSKIFSNCAVAAGITGIDEGLIFNFGVKLRVLYCGWLSLREKLHEKIQIKI